MHALKTPSFLRPASRPSTPLPTTALSFTSEEATADRAARPASKLSLTHFKKPSPAPSAATNQSSLVYDGSYLEALSLKLSEAVSRALTQPTISVAASESINGKGPIPAGRGRAFGELFVHELQGSRGNMHLQRAILRVLQRPLSVLLTNLSTLLLPLLSSPAFLNPPAPTVQQPNPNATQLHALAIAAFCGEILDSLDTLDAEIFRDPRTDVLVHFRDGLNSIIGRVVNPLINGIKGDLLTLVQDLEKVNPASLSSLVKPLTGAKPSATVHPSIASLQSLVSLYAKALSRYTSFKSCQCALATLLISVIWRALVALSHRPSSPRSRSNSVSAASATSAMMIKKRLGTSTSPPTTPPSSRFTMKLPGSRPPSPGHTTIPSAASDSRVLYDLLVALPKPVEHDESSRMAREAVDEAFDALAALTALLGALDSSNEVREDFDLELLTDGLPVVIALPVLLRWSGHGEPQVITAMLGISEADYRNGCLSGFGRADECGAMVAQRILDVLKTEDTADLKTKIVIEYLEASIAH